jgi:hypothetical protein
MPNLLFSMQNDKIRWANKHTYVLKEKKVLSNLTKRRNVKRSDEKSSGLVDKLHLIVCIDSVLWFYKTTL